MRQVKKTMRKQSGIALITTLLLLMLMSAMVVGFILLVTEGQRLSGMNNSQSTAFYGAEAGMEKLTADIGKLFGQTYAPTGPQVDALTLLPPMLSAISARTGSSASWRLWSCSRARAFSSLSKMTRV